MNKAEHRVNVHLHNEDEIYDLLNEFLPENYATEAGRRLMLEGLVVDSTVIRNVRNKRNSVHKNRILKVLCDMSNEEKDAIAVLNSIGKKEDS